MNCENLSESVKILHNPSKISTVTPKTLSILTPNVVWGVHCLIAWDFRLALVELYIVCTLGYKIAPWVMWFGPQGVEIWSIQNTNTMERVFSLLKWKGYLYVRCIYTLASPLSMSQGLLNRFPDGEQKMPWQAWCGMRLQSMQLKGRSCGLLHVHPKWWTWTPHHPSTLLGCLLELATGFAGSLATMASSAGLDCISASDSWSSRVYCSNVPLDDVVFRSTTLAGHGGGCMTCLSAACFAASFHIMPVMAFSTHHLENGSITPETHSEVRPVCMLSHWRMVSSSSVPSFHSGHVVW